MGSEFKLGLDSGLTWSVSWNPREFMAAFAQGQALLQVLELLVAAEYGGRVSRVPLRTVRMALRYGGRVSRVPLRTVPVA